MNMVKMTTYNVGSYSGAANYQVSTTSANGILIDDNIFESIKGEQVVSQIGRYSVMEIANWFLNKSPMSHLKLQKLCYYAQAWSYALNNRRMIDTDFQAWVHGPVSPTLYEKFKGFGYDSIKIRGRYISQITDEDEELLESVWVTYGEYTASALEALTHRELPWMEARVGYRPEQLCKVVISPKTMKKYYLSIHNGELNE